MAEEKKKRGRPKKEKVEAVEAEIVSSPKRYGGNGNLRSIADLSTEEQRAIQSAGGKASVEARRKKKELREFTKNFLLQEANSTLKGNLKALGVEEEDMTNLAAMVVRLFTKATNQGDLNAARTIIEWAGMAPLQQERENAAVAQLSQAMQLADGGVVGGDEDIEDVVFYIPDNGRAVVKDGGAADKN